MMHPDFLNEKIFLNSLPTFIKNRIAALFCDIFVSGTLIVAAMFSSFFVRMLFVG